VQHGVSTKDEGNDEAIALADQVLVAQRWSILWRSVILSALGHTYYPYCQHIKVLDLRDLQNLLEDDQFKDSIRE
jgi:hypothetical protein